MAPCREPCFPADSTPEILLGTIRRGFFIVRER
jgi:hypothetical protein